MEVKFEATRSFAYRFSRYVILPEVQALPQVQSGEPFLLRELAWPLIDEHLTSEQQSVRVKKAHSEIYETIGQIVRWYVPFLAKDFGAFIKLGKGYFRLQTEADVSEEDVVDAAIEDGDEAAEEQEGDIYAFTFPAIIKNDVFPIKVGKTTGDVTARVTDQCRASASFEQPKILGSWHVKRVGPTELAVHNVLKARGKHRENAPGREWFNTTVAELKEIIEFVVGK